MRRARWKRKNVRRVGLRKRRPPAAGGGRLALPCRSQGRKRPALGEPFGPGKSGIPFAPIFAAAGRLLMKALARGKATASASAGGARSEAERAEREAGQMRPCTPTPSAPSATGRQSGEPQKTQACPKAGPNRRLHRYADPRTATLHARAKLRPKRFFSLDRARPVSLLARPKEKWGVHCPAINIADSSVQWDAPQHPPAGYPHTRHSLCKRRSS